MSINQQLEIIKINKTTIGTDEINSVNSREVYEYLGIKTVYANWIKRAIEKYDFVENEDFTISKNGNGNNAIINYIVSMDMVKELCMLSNTKKGKEVRKYFISKEKEVKNQLPFDINNTIQVLDYAKQIALQNQALAIENEAMKPKVLFADSVSQSNTSILIGQFAKAISSDDFKIGQNRLFEWLRNNGYLMSIGQRKNQPMQKYIDNKYFEVVERTIINPDGSVRITITPKITGKGQVALTDKIINSYK